jgi:hypothetical protein
VVVVVGVHVGTLRSDHAHGIATVPTRAPKRSNVL